MPGEYAVRSRPLLPRGKQERLFSFLGYGEGRGMPGMTSSENPRKLRLTRAARRLRRAAVRRRSCSAQVDVNAFNGRVFQTGIGACAEHPVEKVSADAVA